MIYDLSAKSRDTKADTGARALARPCSYGGVAAASASTGIAG